MTDCKNLLKNSSGVPTPYECKWDGAYYAAEVVKKVCRGWTHCPGKRKK